MRLFNKVTFDCDKPCVSAGGQSRPDVRTDAQRKLPSFHSVPLFIYRLLLTPGETNSEQDLSTKVTFRPGYLPGQSDLLERTSIQALSWNQNRTTHRTLSGIKVTFSKLRCDQKVKPESSFTIIDT
nr:Hypothetical_protein [Klebsiella pneumoniae]